MPELVSPAGTAEAISAAVQSGADAVTVSLRGGPVGSKYDIGEEEFGRAAAFCRVRGVKLYAVIELCPCDDEFAAAVESARRASRQGADAVVVHDMGLIWAIRRAIPDLPIHAGSRLGIHNLDGVLLTAAMGAKRVAIAPELSREDVAAICKKSPVEIEVPVHGPLCPAFGGQCLLPALAGEGSAMGDLCTGRCRSFFPMEAARKAAPFQRDELCLAGRLRELRSCGVAALRIEGRDRRPEYVAAVTGVYAKLLGTGSWPSEEDLSILQRAHPAVGFSDGAFGGERQRFPGVSEPAADSFLAAVRRDYLNHEFQRVPVQFSGRVARGEPFQLTAQDPLGNTADAQGTVPEPAFHHAADAAYLTTELSKTGGTPYLCGDVRFAIQRGLYVPPREIAAARDKVLRELSEKRAPFAERAEEEVLLPPHAPNPTEPPVLTVSLQKCSQLSRRLFELAPPVVYLPYEELLSGGSELDAFLQAEDLSVTAVLPAFVRDGDLGELTDKLLSLRQMGVREVLAGNIGHLVFLRKLGFEVRGDMTLNARNSAAMYTLGAFRLRSLTLPPDLSVSRVRAISKELPTELVVYGRMPLMVTGRCVIKDVLGTCSCDGLTGISDESGFTYPVTHGPHCQNTVWSAKKLFLAGKSREYLSSGLWGVRLNFTTESAGECAQIAERYLELSSYEPASYVTNLF